MRFLKMRVGLLFVDDDLIRGGIGNVDTVDSPPEDN